MQLCVQYCDFIGSLTRVLELVFGVSGLKSVHVTFLS